MCRPGGRVVYRPPVPVIAPIKPVSPQSTKQHACPVTESAVNVAIRDFCASVTLAQTFKNVEENPIEAIYQFPLDDKYCICDFTAEIDGKVIKGKCKEKEQAKDDYDDAIASGHGAYLLEQDEKEPNVFKMNVGNLPSGKEVKITLTYVAELEFVEGALQFVLASAKGKETADNKNLPGLKFSVNLEMTSNIKSLSSPSHPISFEFGDEPTQATVTLGAEGALLQKDFVLSVKLAKPHQPCAQVQKDKEGNVAAMVSLYPEIQLGEDEEIYTECIFLIDRSGSMAGSRISQVRDTMQIFLRSLGEGTLFNIVGFGSRADFLFKNGSVEYNDKNLDIATKHISTLAANLGGTNILKPLLEILKSKPVEGYPRQLFILTDGEVDNTKQCIETVRTNAHTTRVFTFGIGNEASQELVKGMAQAAEGFFEFVQTGENMEAKVMRQLRRAMKPALTDLEVDWGELPVEQAPYRLPPLFLGGRLIVYGFFPPGAKESTVTLKAKTAIKPFETSVKINPEAAKEGTLFHALGAKQLIKNLEEGRSYLHTLDGQLISGKTSEHIKQETIRLSTNYGVLCKLTAFVAVEEREEATEGTMQVRKIGIDTAAPAPPPAPIQISPTSHSLQPQLQQQQQQQQPISAKQSQGPASPRRLASPPPPPSAGAAPPPAPMAKLSSASYSAPQSLSRTSLSMDTNSSVLRSQSVSASVAPSAPAKKGFSFFGKKASPAPVSTPVSSAAPAREMVDRKKSKSKKRVMKDKKESKKMDKEKEKCEDKRSRRSSGESVSKKCEEVSASLSSLGDLDQLIALPQAECLSSYASIPNDDGDACGMSASSEDEAESEEEKKEEEEVVEAAPAEMRSIIMKQKASGSWTLSDVGTLLGSFSAEKLKKALSSLVTGDTGGDVENLWVTAVVVAYLQVKWPRQKTNWELVVSKGTRWVGKQAKSVSVKPEGFDFIAEAMKFVKAN